MNRRSFIGMLAGGLFAAPRVVGAQQAKVYRVGILLQGWLPGGDERARPTPARALPHGVAEARLD